MSSSRPLLNSASLQLGRADKKTTASATDTTAPTDTTSSLTSSLSSSITSSSDIPTTSSDISTSTASSAPPSTVLVTSVVTRSASGTSSESQVVVTITSSSSQTTAAPPTTTSSSSTTSSSTTPASLQGDGSGSSKSSSGLSAGGKTAIAVVVPVVVVAILVIAGIFLWRKRKQRKNEEEQRRKEMEDYGYNPNNDPTLPAVGGVSGSQMAEDESGYRGWGGTQATSNRKASTTISGGMTGGLSDTTSQPGGYHSPGSPSFGTDGNSADPLMAGAAGGAAGAAAMHRRETMESDNVGALGSGPAANQNRGVQRGPSNASSSYSAGERHSGDAPIPVNGQYDEGFGQENPYYQAGPYDGGAYGGAQPIVRDVQARRNTRIENPSVRPQQGNSGIAQNF